MVWTPQLTGGFPHFVKTDWLYELCHSFVFLGPRPGHTLWLRISQQIVEVACKLYGEQPKADSVHDLSLSLASGDDLVTTGSPGAFPRDVPFDVHTAYAPRSNSPRQPGRARSPTRP
ncbi:hypothetical protein AB0L75_18005 [Streptomyces sp. NPDC052101]|uniref:hypothetical protein n=1 Tax=Streptomyces sp. NPDC052101 TaxID=3155763 RepID=UPI00344541CB